MMFFFYQYICFGYTTDRERILKPRWNSTDKTNDANKMKWWVSFKQIGFSDSSSLAIPVGDAYGIVDVHFFFPPLLSGPYLWNRYSQRLQIQCAAWACGLVLHYCLPSNSLRYYFFFHFFLFFCHDFVRAISLEPLLAETPNWVCCLVLWSNFALLLTIQFASLFIFFFFATILPQFCPGHISGTVTRRDSKLSVLLGPAV